MPHTLRYIPRRCAGIARITCNTTVRSFGSRSFEWSSEWIGKSNNDTDDGRLVVFLHGLMGNKRNVKTFASSVCDSLQVSGLLLDVRGHGNSQLPPHAIHNKTSLLDCVWDLDTTLQAVVPDIEDRELIIMGHSLGGRITMLYAITHSVIQKPSHCWLLDTPPGRMGTSVLQVLKAANKLAAQEGPAVITKRKELTHVLVEEHDIDKGTAQWLATAYDPTLPSKFKFDLNVAQDLVDDFETMDFMGWIEQALEEQHVGIHMIHGAANSVWEETGMLETFQSMAAERKPEHFSFHTLPEAGHWVHIDDPKGLLSAVESVHKT